MACGLDMAGVLMVQGVETVGPARGPVDALRRHWPEYLMEAGGLGLFMVSAGLCATLLWYPDSPLASAIPDGIGRRAVMGLVMGLTAIIIIYSPWASSRVRISTRP